MHLQEDFPEVATYLESVASTIRTDAPGAPQNAVQTTSTHYTPSQHAQNIASEELTSEMMEAVQEIMQRHEAAGTDPDSELRTLVGQTVLEGVATGYQMSIDPSERREDGDSIRERDSLHGAKRSRTDDGSGPQP